MLQNSLFCNKSFAYSFNPFNINSSFSTEVLNTFNISDISQNIDSPPLTFDYYVVSDEEESFYLPTYFGFYKFNNKGELVYEVKVNNNDYINVSNLIYTEQKIIFLSKKWPGTIYVYNSTTGEQISNYTLFLQSEKPTNTNLITFSNITLDYQDKAIYFATNYYYRFYKYFIPLNNTVFFDLKEKYLEYTGGLINLAPIIYDSKVIFVTSKDLIYVFDTNNIASYVFTAYFSTEYNFLKQYGQGVMVPFAITPTNFYTQFHNYLCVFSNNGTASNLCKQFVNSSNRENTVLITPKAVNNNLAVFYYVSTPQGTKQNYVSLFDENLNKQWYTPIDSMAERGGVYIDKNNNVIVSSATTYVINNQSGEVLGEHTTSLNTGYSPFRYSLPSITANGDFYILKQQKKYSNNQTNNIVYKFKGSGVVNECPLKIYCNSTPKHNPVILIHGLGGHYSTWANEKTGILRQKILEEFKKDDPEFPDDWVYAYSYGYNFNGNYNYQGKIEDISSNLHFDIPRLSEQHKLAGGDGKVTLIGYSLGGLVARHYLLEKTGFPGTQNLNVDTGVNKVIFIASPINGSSILQSLDEFSTMYPTLGTKAIDALNKGISEFQDQEIDITKDIGSQLPSNSEYLFKVSNYFFPEIVKFYRDYSNLSLGISYRLFDYQLNKKADIGDFAVRPKDTILSNSTLSGDSLFENSIGLNVFYKNGVLIFESDPIFDSLRFNHLSILEQPELINSVINQLKE